MHSPPELDSCGIGFVADARGRPSRQVVDAALRGLAAVTHRGALAADARTADGSGVMLPIPAALFGSDTGVASLFVRGPDPRRPLEQAAASEGITVEGWRVPETDDAQLGDQARASRPRLLQAVLGNPPGGAGSGRAERAAYRLRRRMTIEGVLPGTYVASCSYRTVVYKGLVAANLLAAFYADLGDPSVEAPFVIFHQRFSTNTAPSWERAQPFRTLCHNGEINTIAGNVARMAGRHRLGTEAAGLGPEELFRPLLHPADSDSGMLDSAVELLIRAGRDPRHAVAMLVPPAWEGDGDLDPEVRGFFRFHSALCEPWDGPAGVIFTDGAGVGAALDRNGLRPLRYAVCDDGLVVCCSEAGAVDVSGHGKVRRGRLGPGQMMFVDPTRGVLDDAHCKQRLAAAGSYAKWSGDGFARVDGAGPAAYVDDDPDDLAARQAAHGYTVEELRMVLGPMAADAKEPTFAMGDDTPAPPLATTPRPVSHYLKQRFAQVTNPPIDHLRERLVMTLRTLLGPRHPLLDETPAAARLVELETFLLFPSTVSHLTAEGRSPFPWARLEAGFDAGAGPAELGRAVAALAAEASAAVAGGAGLVVVDNRHFSADRAPIPSWLAVGAIHGRLVADRRRDQTSLVAVADDVRDVHGTAALLGCGADAICPELALATVAAIADASDDSDVTSPEAQERLVAALEDGVLKVMSKMGIATVDSYRGAMIFEAVGLGADVVETCFPGLVSTVGGVGWAELGADALRRHRAATIAEGAGQKVALTNPGFYRDLKRGGEYHAHNKAVVDALHAHVLQRALRNGDAGLYRAFADLVDGRPPTELHDLLELVPVGPAVDLEEVEPAAAIVERFSTGAMSHGSLSAEAHETLAQAMNLIGGRSNCGEGGEDPSRFRTRGAPGRDKNSKIKQVASGRFGVTPEYCAHADELQIKIAQGSKPGEGGQLPGHKVSEEIARLRHTQSGVTLISPPPHHDIYSIEDLAQLIYDLKQVNPFADVSVKLVSEDGVGTIAAGVVKALADVVAVSGANGGTGASPLSSIKHAGLPWELGLVDTQVALIRNGLRDRVRVRVDGGFMTGRDVMVAALLGADEFSFGTAAMIAEGCIMLRACHKDTCTVGVATQRPHLRARFSGTPEGVAAYLTFVAEDVRRHLAALGLRSVEEAVGRVECLRPKRAEGRAAVVDVGALLRPAVEAAGGDGTAGVGGGAGGGGGGGSRGFVAGLPIQRPRSALGDRLVSEHFRHIWDGDTVEATYPISNADRAVGAALGGALALEFGAGSPPGSATLRFEGSAGQSFGSFLTAGVTLDLTGEANDYVGKGMGGGLIVIRPPGDDAGNPALAGNTCLYGATGGSLHIAGSVGERFAVRNSGAVAVVEGAGDHLCEYMTGGTVVVLGPVGRNVGAGMTGGVAYAWDPGGRFPTRVNAALVEVGRPSPDSLQELRWLIDRHHRLTGSSVAAQVLGAWHEAVDQLWVVAPAGRSRRLGVRAAGVVSSA